MIRPFLITMSRLTDQIVLVTGASGFVGLNVVEALLGAGRGMWQLGALTSLSQAPALRFGDVTPIGPDLRILARPAA